MNVGDVIKAVEQFALPELGQFVQGICPCLPVEALEQLLEAVTNEITARNHVDAMQAAVSGADAVVDAFEKEVNDIP